jgi:hypothetical protein
MDAPPREGAPERVGQSASEWVEEFKGRSLEVQRAADEWAVRWQEPEGRFVSALLGAVETLGRQAMIEAVARDSRAAAEAEYAQAREVTKAAQLALKQARNAQLALVVEQENVTLRMIDQTLPLFAERLEKVLVIREQRWNADVRRRRYALAGAETLAVFVGGIALAAWMDGDKTAAFDRCLTQSIDAQGHRYCDITSFAVPSHASQAQ